ncbi:MAG: chorismate-binding protein, partial [Rhodobacteraceae bacterium]|nr:chorismate-binding protein [Paracoccaceae bacterium]
MCRPTACCRPRCDALRAPAASILDIDFRDPAAAFAPLAEEPFAILLDSASGGARGRYALICASPTDVFRYDEISRAPFEVLASVVGHDGYRWDGPGPFAGGAVGFLGYELGGALERLPPPKPPAFPYAAALGIYRTFAVFDLIDRRAWAVDIDGHAGRAKALAVRLGHRETALPAFDPVAWTPDLTKDGYCRRVGRIVEYVAAGDIFQANFAQRWTAPWPQGIGAFDVYARLRARAPAPFCSFMNVGADAAFMSVSPERFLNVSAAGHVETRPIKGTRPRGPTPGEDRRNADALLASGKDRAENLM